MKNNEVIFKDYFCGNRISDYGREHGRVDYATLAKAFDAVLNNQIISVTGWENWEQENGYIDNSEEIEELTEKIEALEDERADLEDILYRYDNGKDCGIPLSQIAATRERFDKVTSEIYELEQERDNFETEQDEQPEIFQYFIISGNGAQILEDYTNEIVFYNNDLDMYVWGVCHWGTSWDYVLTDIRCEKETKTA